MRAVIRRSNDLHRIANQLSPKLDGSPYQVTIKPFKRDRTPGQNSKVHAMISDLAIHTGYSARDMKEIVKHQFGPSMEGMLGDDGFVIPKSIGDYNVDECAAVIDRLKQLGAALDCAFTRPS